MLQCKNVKKVNLKKRAFSQSDHYSSKKAGLAIANICSSWALITKLVDTLKKRASFQNDPYSPESASWVNDPYSPRGAGWVRTCLSSPAEKRYGCLVETASPRTVETWPVRESLSLPEARSHILITRSAAPVTNHSLPGSTATDLWRWGGGKG